MKKTYLAILFIQAYCNQCLQAQSQTVPRDTSYTLHSTYLHNKKHHPEIEPAGLDMPNGLTVFSDIVYTTLHNTPYGERKLLATIYRPADQQQYPALILVHGGGWNSGDKSLQAPLAMAIAAHGYVTMVVEYRLCPEAIYPAALHDLKTAVRWLRANAGTYGIDAGKIAMSGCSAGGHLATLVGITNGSARHEGEGEWAEYGSDVQAVVNMDGCSTFVSQRNIDETKDKFLRLQKLPITAQWLGGLYEDARGAWIEASPTMWVTQHSAPVCFINSQLPRYSDGKESLIDKLESHGIFTESHSLDAPLHTFWFFHPWFNMTVCHTVNFLNTVFKCAHKETEPQHHE